MLLPYPKPGVVGLGRPLGVGWVWVCVCVGVWVGVLVGGWGWGGGGGGVLRKNCTNALISLQNYIGILHHYISYWFLQLHENKLLQMRILDVHGVRTIKKMKVKCMFYVSPLNANCDPSWSCVSTLIPDFNQSPSCLGLGDNKDIGATGCPGNSWSVYTGTRAHGVRNRPGMSNIMNMYVARRLVTLESILCVA